MNKIVREHYPVSDLPDGIRKEFTGLETVRLVVEGEARSDETPIDVLEANYKKHWEEIASQGPVDFSRHNGRTTIEEAVARVRRIRDEWDEE